MANPTLLIIILNYRTAELTLAALTAAHAQTKDIPGGMIVVDNDSGDGSFEKITQAVTRKGWHEAGRVRVLQSGQNGGFGAGNNFGIRAGLPDGSAPDYIYILNPDATPEKGAIRLLLDHLEGHPQTGFAGSSILSETGELQRTVFRFPSIAGEFEAAARLGPLSRLLAGHIVAMPVPEQSGPVDWLVGASLMMRREMLDQIGLFDEGFFLYFEETDLCLRAAKAGWSTDYVRESRVCHIGSAATGMKRWQRVPTYWFDSRLRYFNKNHGAIYTAAATAAHLAGGALNQLRRLVQRKPTNSPRYFLRDMAGHGLKAALKPPHKPTQNPQTTPARNDRREA
jgi:GT2 family glycosyltransferase